MNFATRAALLALASLLALGTAQPAAAAAAASDDSDRPILKHFPGSKVVKRSARNYDEYWMALGRLAGDGQADKVQLLEGKWIHATLAQPEGRSVAEVYRHYEQELSRKGFQTVYTCKDVECGEGGRKTNGDWWPLTDTRRYLVGRLERPGEGDVWVSVHVHARKPTLPGQHEVDIIETKLPAEPPAARNEADVTTLERELRANGRVVLRSLGFVDTRATLLPESQSVVKAIADLLARDPGLKLHVVVHSDNTGPAAASMELSKKRAATIVTLLSRRHRVPAARVRPAGVGPLAPIANNETEQGREKNRRVELVPQGPVRGPAAAQADR